MFQPAACADAHPFNSPLRLARGLSVFVDCGGAFLTADLVIMRCAWSPRRTRHGT